MSGQRSTPAVSIGQLSIQGVDLHAAQNVGPALRRALERAAENVRLPQGQTARLKLSLPHGATERDVAAALVKALERG